MDYRGRFAPSPTGSLHLGSLVAALGSYLDARASQGTWIVRIEDLDPPREVPGAANEIIQTLAAHGLQWDEEIIYQSHRHHAYQDAADVLLQNNHAYYCTCTRSQLASSSRRAKDGSWIYPGTCRDRHKTHGALRFKTSAEPITVIDQIQPTFSESVAADVGDFVIKRSDGLWAYQLAVVVDDAFQHITHVVRGADLLDSTPRQIALQRALGYATPVYAHLPIVTNEQGEKLSKQTFAKPVDAHCATQNLWQALRFLQQNPPESLAYATPQALLAWATEHWNKETCLNGARSRILPLPP